MQKLALRSSHRKLLFLIIILVGAFFAWTKLTTPRGAQKVVFTPARENCYSEGRLKYCVYRAVSGVNDDVIYHLHGRNLDEKVWNDNTYWTSMVQYIWQNSGLIPPTVVTISYGPTWLLVPKGKRQDSGLLADFMASLPDIEKRTGTPKRRLLLGESMGGLNVLVVGLTYPNSFAKIASLCPGVYAVSPFAAFPALWETLERTGGDPKIGFGIWRLATKNVADEAEWKRISPLELIKRANAQYPAMYLSNGLYDAYGNFEGTQRLAERAAERGVSVEWHPLYGGHCAIDTSSLARFLTS